MTVEAGNKRVVAAFVEAFNAGDFDQLQNCFTDDAMVFAVAGWGALDNVMPIWRELHSSMRMHLTVESMIAEGDVVAVRYTERGQWVAPFQGHENPTGGSYAMVALAWFELKAGKIHRRWGARDSATQARQTGLPL